MTLADSHAQGGDERRWHEMTVARVRERPDHVDVVFLESARIYKLSRAHPRLDSILAQLRNALERRRVVRVQVASNGDATIEDVQDA
ncbi:MAG: hypothetical protein ACT4P6_12510 [Gemmatimonadaceae bacterium]